MSRIASKAAFLSVAVLAASPAAAQDVWQGLAADGAVTVDEVRYNEIAAYQGLDYNGDGIVSRREFVQRQLPADIGPAGPNPDMREELFGMMDENGDGQIGFDEWRSSLDENVSMADANDDGAVTLEELAQLDAGTALASFFGFE